MLITTIFLPLTVAPEDPTLFFYGVILIGSLQSGLLAGADPLLMDSIEARVHYLGYTDLDLFGIVGTLRSIAWGSGFVIGPLIAGILLSFVSIPLMAILLGIFSFVWTLVIYRNAHDYVTAEKNKR